MAPWFLPWQRIGKLARGSGHSSRRSENSEVFNVITDTNSEYYEVQWDYNEVPGWLVGHFQSSVDLPPVSCLQICAILMKTSLKAHMYVCLRRWQCLIMILTLLRMNYQDKYITPSSNHQNPSGSVGGNSTSLASRSPSYFNSGVHAPQASIRTPAIEQPLNLRETWRATDAALQPLNSRQSLHLGSENPPQGYVNSHYGTGSDSYRRIWSGRKAGKELGSPSSILGMNQGLVWGLAMIRL